MAVLVVTVVEAGGRKTADGDYVHAVKHGHVIAIGHVSEQDNFCSQGKGNTTDVERRPSWDPGVPGAILSDVADDEQFRCLLLISRCEDYLASVTFSNAIGLDIRVVRKGQVNEATVGRGHGFKRDG